MEGFDKIGSYIGTYGPIEYRITWYHTLSAGATTKEDYYVPGHADHLLTAEEYLVIRELLANHSEIKDWWIKNNILYLEIVDE